MQCHECFCCDLVDDACTGDTICTGCGLVLDQQAFVNPAVHDGAVMEEVLTTQKIANCPRRLQFAGGDSSKLRGGVAGSCEIQTVSGRLALPEPTAELACKLWKDIVHKRTCKGDLRKGILAASIYFACKVSGFPRPKRSIAAACGTPVDVVAKGIKLHLQLSRSEQMQTAKPADSGDVLAVHLAAAAHLVPCHLSRRTLAHARKLDAEITNAGILEGKTPHVRAAAALYITLKDLGLPAAELPDAAGISRHTLTRTLAVLNAHGCPREQRP